MAFAGQGRSIGIMFGGIFLALFGTIALVAGIVIRSGVAEGVGGSMLAGTVLLFVWFFYEYKVKYAVKTFLGIFIHAWDGNNFSAYIAPEEIQRLSSVDLVKDLQGLYKKRDDGRELGWYMLTHRFEFQGFAVVASLVDPMLLSRAREGMVTIEGFLRSTKVADVAAVEVWHDLMMVEPSMSRLDRLRVALHTAEAPPRFDYEYIPYLYVNDSDLDAAIVRNRFMGLDAGFADFASFEKALPIIRKEAQAVWGTAKDQKIRVLEDHIEDQREIMAGYDRDKIIDKAPELEGDRGGRPLVDWKKWAKRVLLGAALLALIYGAYWLLHVYLGVV